MMGGFEGGPDVPDRSASDIMDSMTPTPDQLNAGDEKGPEVKRELTAKDLEDANPGFKRTNPDKHPDVVKAAREAIRAENKAQAERDKSKAKPIAPGDQVEYTDSVYNPDTQKMEDTPFVYGVGTNGEHLLVKGKTVSRKPNKQEQASIDAQNQENAEEMDEELAAHVEAVLKKEFRGKPSKLAKSADMYKKTVAANRKYLKEDGGYGFLTKGSKKWLAINTGGGNIAVYEGKSS